MKILIASYMTPQASHRFSFFHKVTGNFSYFVASELCENFPFDFSVARLKNKCIKAAKIIKPDWLIILSGIDSSIIKLPSFKKLDSCALHLGYRMSKENIPEKCSNWILSKKIYENFLLDEEFKCYGWEDFDFVYNVCKDIKKQSCRDFLTVDINDDNVDTKLISKSPFAIENWESNKTKFLNKYMRLNKLSFDFEKHDSLK
jgi:hypothetical protein